jgi:hypothetical protein
MKSQIETQDVADIVTRHLLPHQPNDYKLAVSDDIYRSGNWWYVVVQPDRPNIRVYDYNHIVQRVEDEIEDQEHIKVLLVPAMPD